MHRMRLATLAPPAGLRRRVTVRGFAAGALAAMALGCEGSDAYPSAPRGADAFARFEVIGGAYAAGAQSGGLVSASQWTAWPALLAAAMGAPFAQPLHRAPGCAPPLAAPLLLGVRISASSITTPDSSCASADTKFTAPGNNLAIAGATAWDAVHVTPRAIGIAPAGTYDAVTRARYAAVLALTQSQVTAMLVSRPTFVAVELGLGEVIRAATSGRVVAATDYGAPAGWTLAPPAVAIPLLDAIADSVAKSGARAVLLSVPRIATFPAFVPAGYVWGERAALASFGVTVSADCATSGNVVNVAALVPLLVARAAAAGSPQALSCADTPGAADGILSPGDIATIEATVAGINEHLRGVAASRGWAYADLGDLYATMTATPGYSATAQLTCESPYGAYLSLDGINPSAAGQRRIADAVATAVNGRYGFAIPIIGDSQPAGPAGCRASSVAARYRGAAGSSVVRETPHFAAGGPRHNARAWLH